MGWDWELLAGPDTITEGPAWDRTGLFFASIDRHEIRRYDLETGTIAVVYRDTGGANGLLLGPDGPLYACKGVGRAIARYDTGGAKAILVDRFEGKRLNSPNDLALDSRGASGSPTRATAIRAAASSTTTRSTVSRRRPMGVAPGQFGA